MLAHYLTTALRLLWRERGYAAINVFGLAIGFSLCLLIIQFTSHQLAVGTFHENGDRIYRVLGPGFRGAAFGTGLPIHMGPALEEQLPQVEEAVRFRGKWPTQLRLAGRESLSDWVLMAEDGVLQVFGFPLLRGDPQTALARPYTMVLTEPLARRLFGDDDPMGQVIRIDEQYDCEVTGIVGQPPPNSLLEFSAILSFATMYEESRGMMESRSAKAFITYVQLSPGADLASIEERLPAMAEELTGLPEEDGSTYKLQPLKSIRFDADVPNSLGPSGNPLYLAVCAALAAVILAIAGVNYVNLATARADRRTHEIGVRKSLGAQRGQLIRQLLCESVVLSAGATLLGAAATQILVRLPALITGMPIDLPFMRWTIPAAAGAAALALVIGLAAGAYPAWLVARFQPAAVVRRRRSGGARLRQVLVVGQFTITAALMTMTLLIWSQVGYVQDLLRRESALGFEPEQVTVVRNQGLTLEQTRVLKSELLQDSRVALVSLSETLPGNLSRTWYGVKGEDAGEVEVRTYGVDGDFFEMLGLRMSRGRALTDDPSDDRAAVINETAVRRMGWEDPLGKAITGYMGRDLRVVGVVEDFHFDGPHKKVEPLLMAPVSNVGPISVRARPGHLDEVNELIDAKWAALSPHRPIERMPLEEVFAGLYMEELMMGKALTVFLSFAIAVALVGLFGMAAHAAQNRIREIGVRKVFGASVTGLTAMMLRDFAKPVGLAFLLSVPISWWLGGLWLQNYTYHVEVGVGLYLTSAALSFLVAGLTVGRQAIRASLTNPVETLRTE
ncbi:MAG: ABC transporter permease [Gemmatimonadaceae bacterium]|nr:ABC transporter permease [Gemmatimonadaceae bacterium]